MSKTVKSFDKGGKKLAIPHRLILPKFMANFSH